MEGLIKIVCTKCGHNLSLTYSREEKIEYAIDSYTSMIAIGVALCETCEYKYSNKYYALKAKFDKFLKSKGFKKYVDNMKFSKEDYLKEYQDVFGDKEI